jgi:hypothetical protein
MVLAPQGSDGLVIVVNGDVVPPLNLARLLL